MPQCQEIGVGRGRRIAMKPLIAPRRTIVRAAFRPFNGRGRRVSSAEVRPTESRGRASFVQVRGPRRRGIMDEKTAALVPITVFGPTGRNAGLGRSAGPSQPRARTEHQGPYRTVPKTKGGRWRGLHHPTGGTERLIRVPDTSARIGPTTPKQVGMKPRTCPKLEGSGSDYAKRSPAPAPEALGRRGRTPHNRGLGIRGLCGAPHKISRVTCQSGTDWWESGPGTVG